MHPPAPSLPGVRPALVVAHPGHELRLHGWLELARPRVLVLTDGSGASGRSRLASTTRLLAAAGTAPGAVYGRLTDRELYAAILARDAALALGLVEELAATLVREGVDYVVTDALEGYNPAHDLCHVLVGAAVATAARAGRQVAHFDFPLAGPPDARGNGKAPVAFRLDDAALARKLAAARDYVGLGDEVRAALTAHGVEGFLVECLRPLAPGPFRARPPADPPFYERYGEAQVAAGVFSTAIRRARHVAPIEHAIDAWRASAMR